MVKRTPGMFKAVLNKQFIGHRRVVVVSSVVRERKTLLLNGR